MAGTVVVDTVKSSTTGAPVFQNTNGTTIGTLCRAWVNFNGSTTSPTIRASFNVSSVTYVSSGVFTINFTSAFPDANYSYSGSHSSSSSGASSFVLNNIGATAPTTTAATIATYVYAAAAAPTYVNAAFFR